MWWDDRYILLLDFDILLRFPARSFPCLPPAASASTLEEIVPSAKWLPRRYRRWVASIDNIIDFQPTFMRVAAWLQLGYEIFKRRYRVQAFCLLDFDYFASGPTRLTFLDFSRIGRLYFLDSITQMIGGHEFILRKRF